MLKRLSTCTVLYDYVIYVIASFGAAACTRRVIAEMSGTSGLMFAHLHARAASIERSARNSATDADDAFVARSATTYSQSPATLKRSQTKAQTTRFDLQATDSLRVNNGNFDCLMRNY